MLFARNKLVEDAGQCIQYVDHSEFFNTTRYVHTQANTYSALINDHNIPESEMI